MNKLTLFSDTFLWLKGDRGLLYNSKTHSSDEFHAPQPVKALCEQLQNYDNLYSVMIDSNAVSEDCMSFIEIISNKGYGLVSSDLSNFVSLPPLLNVQHKDAKLSYLSYVTLFLGGKCKQTEYYKQVMFPFNSGIQLSGEDAEKFILKIGPDYLKNVNIVVSDPSENSYIIDIVRRIATITERVSLVIPLSDNNKKTCLELAVQANASFKSVFVCCADDISKDTIKELSDKGHFNLLVRNENECSHLETIVEGLSDIDYDVSPVYEDNLAFFEKNVFMSKKDLKSLSPSKREVFAHQAINTNFFGELTLMPDGTVYTNVNFPSVGTVNDSIYDIVRKALNKDEAWLYLRDKAPCSRCLYQWLCPSVSNYEIVMNRMDLCLQPQSDNLCSPKVKKYKDA